MAYTRSIREIGLDEEPVASALAAVLPDPDESPYSDELRWDNATEEQIKILRLHAGAAVLVGSPPGEGPEVGDSASDGEVG
jgi:hypothetical protein